MTIAVFGMHDNDWHTVVVDRGWLSVGLISARRYAMQPPKSV